VKKKCLRLAFAALCWSGSASLWAADFDGSKPLLCATVDAHACDAGEVCLRGLPVELGVPQFLRIDFARKIVVGRERTTPIRLIDADQSQTLLQGAEFGFAWTIALDRTDGTITGSLVNSQDAYVLFGACTPDKP